MYSYSTVISVNAGFSCLFDSIDSLLVGDELKD